MRFIHVRNGFFQDATLGTLNVEYSDGTSEYVCETLEDRDRRLEESQEGKVYGNTAIPRGSYKVALTHSPKFGRKLLELLGVSGFSGIRVHAGNSSLDTDGCVLVGMERHKRSIGRSREALEKVESLAKAAFSRGESITWEIV